ncbi:DUF7144 family membrane protein [Nocardia alni]|uniref:DUF7144 family membrane protein n=1 Tax=Nocardia alni TaxID=2815723 RepID=UPI0027DF1DC1|nr:hypothetical protein [Nocardia alni]
MSNPTPVTPAPVLPTDPNIAPGIGPGATAAPDTESIPGGRHEGGAPPARQQAAAMGTIAAAVLLIVAGAVQILEGISAVEADSIVVVGPQYTYQWSTTGWGVVHIVIGALLVLIAAALFTGWAWARAAAIVFAAASIVANFLWLPHNPWWSVLIIALDAFLIWAVATWNQHGPDTATPNHSS